MTVEFKQKYTVPCTESHKSNVNINNFESWVNLLKNEIRVVI